MNTQMERLFHSIRRGIEDNVRLAVRTMEGKRGDEFKELKEKIEQIRTKEFKVLKKKLDEIKGNLKKVDALKPYLSAIEIFAKAAMRKNKPAKKSRAKKARKKTVRKSS